MKKASRTIKFISGITTALFLTLAGCAIDNPIDYTTEGYVGVPNDNSNSDSGNDNVIAEIPECVISDFHWSNPPQVNGYSAQGTINGINYTYNSSSPVYTTTYIVGQSVFPSSYQVPNQTSIKNVYATTNSLSFEAPIANPILVFASIGRPTTYVPIEFSAPIEVLWSQNVVQDSDTKITGNEGYAVVRLNGTFSEVSFNYLANENWVNFAFGADFYTVCDGNGAAGTVEWTRQLGTPSRDYVNDISTDSSGHVYVLVNTEGGIDDNTNAGGKDFFVVKYDSAGVKQWTQQLGSSSNEYSKGISTDSSGNVYVTVRSYLGDLDGNTNLGDNDVFVVKYDSAGVKQWTQQLHSDTEERLEDGGIATDSSGNIYVTGVTYGGTGWDGEELLLDGNTNAGEGDIFVVKYDSGGIKQWTQQIGTSNQDYSEGITTDSNGNVYVTGWTEGGLDGNTNAGDADLFVIKYDSDGVKQWTQQMGTSSRDYASGISIDNSNNVYVEGGTKGILDGNGNAGSWDIFVVKYDSSGNKQWTQQMGTSYSDGAKGISIDNTDTVYVTGNTEGSLDNNTNAGDKDLFLMKLK